MRIESFHWANVLRLSLLFEEGMIRREGKHSKF